MDVIAQMKVDYDIDLLCSKKGSDDYASILEYIDKNGADYQFDSKEEANQFLNKLKSIHGGVYSVQINDKYLLITP